MMRITFSIKYQTRWGESLAVVLDDKSHLLHWNEGGFWSGTIEVKVAWLRDYTYVVIEDGIIVRREWAHHHSKASSEIEDSWIDCPIPGCPFIQEHQAAEFDKPGFRGAGVAVPVFSLRTADDFGIGEFNDLRPLVDWAVSTGLCIIQLLPVNDTTRNGGWADSYPYSPVSSFALNPMYIHLQDLGVEEDPSFRALQTELNTLDELDYPRVFKAKREYTLKAFAVRGLSELASRGYKSFVRDNAFWLDEYAAFCSERDGIDPDYFRWIQWHLEKQFARQVDYARSKGVHFKGDLPIGVSADSAEAHFHPELFNLDSTAGAPPDYFSKDGQNWGFPTYNWEEMSKDEYAWWKARLRKMSRFFDAFRIDHILGFFRIWEIPVGSNSGIWGHFNPALPYTVEEIGLPLEGLFHEDPRNPGMYQPLITPQVETNQRFNALYNDFFYHRHDDFWRRNALKKLPHLLGATGMLACGEDLGMVPDCVQGVMAQERILSLEMSEMDKGRPWPYLAVCATSSHDMETLRMQIKRKKGYDPEAEEVCDIVRGQLSSIPMLSINPLQDYLAMDAKLRLEDCMRERINEPADPHHHWRYRVHLDIKKLPACKEFCGKLLSMVRESGREATSPRR